MNVDLVAHELAIRRDFAGKLDLAHAQRTALAGATGPTEPVANGLPHRVEAKAARHHRVAREMACEEPQARINIQLTDDMPLAVDTAIHADLGNPVHHQHWRRRQLRISGSEIPTLARFEQVILRIAGLRRVIIVRTGHRGFSWNLA